MPKELRTKPEDFINKAILTSNNRAFVRLLDLFRQDLLKRFDTVKDNIEDWSDPITYEDLLKDRIRVLAAKASWSENNLLDMNLISIILWNIKETE